MAGIPGLSVNDSGPVVSGSGPVTVGGLMFQPTRRGLDPAMAVLGATFALVLGLALGRKRKGRG